MDNNQNISELERRIRSHSYPSNPTINNYVMNRRTLIPNTEEYMCSLEQNSGRERHLSGVSVASSGQHSVTDQMDCHERCITPVPTDDHRYDDLRCKICHSIAINPFRCTAPNQPIGVDDRQPAFGHLICYQCLTTYMVHSQSDCVLCPYCLTNVFDLDNLVAADEQIIREAENCIVFCPNNCGLMGSPLTIANHICVLQNRRLSGHTPFTNICADLMFANTNLNRENIQLRQEVDHLLRNYRSGRAYWKPKVELWKARCASAQITQQTQQELSSNANDRLRHRVQELSGMLDKMREEKNEIKRKFKSKLNLVAKFYQTKVEELEEINGRLSNELRDIIDMSVVPGEEMVANGLPPNVDENIGDRLESLDINIESLFEFPPLPLIGATATIATIAADYGAQPVIDSSSDEETVASNGF